MTAAHMQGYGGEFYQPARNQNFEFNPVMSTNYGGVDSSMGTSNNSNTVAPQRNGNIGLLGSPGNSASQKVSHQSSSIGAWGSTSRSFARSKQAMNSATTQDSSNK